MIEELTELLESLGYEVYKQGSITDSRDYPDHFFTVWNDDTVENGHYDNKPVEYIWYFTINFYSVNPLIAADAIVRAKNVLEENGWTVPGKGSDAYSDSKHHSGRSIEAIYIEKI